MEHFSNPLSAKVMAKVYFLKTLKIGAWNFIPDFKDVILELFSSKIRFGKTDFRDPISGPL